MPEPYYTFFLNMWIMRRTTVEILQTKVPKYITQAEYEVIIATPQMTEAELAEAKGMEGA